MNRNTPDPYNGFKNDVERRRALNVRAICAAVVALSASDLPKEMLSWLRIWFP